MSRGLARLLVVGLAFGALASCARHAQAEPRNDDGGLTPSGGSDLGGVLQRGEWVVRAIDGAPVRGEARATLRFTPDGRVAGRAFCNRFVGRYVLAGTALRLHDLAATMMACAPALMESEAAFLGLLARTSSVELRAADLIVLHADDGRTIEAAPTR